MTNLQIPLNPAPLPMSIGIGEQEMMGEDGPQKFVQLIFSGPFGVFIATVEPDAMTKVMNDMKEKILQMKSGLTIARDLPSAPPSF